MSDQISACNRLQGPCNRLHCVISPKLSFLAQARQLSLGRESSSIVQDFTLLDKKKVQYDLKAKNILTSALGIDEFFRVDHTRRYRRGKEIKTKHSFPGYEMFRMRPGHKILDLQRRFTNLINHLVALGKVLLNSELNLKEHELELSQLDQHEEQEKKKKNISLKAKIEKYDSSEDEDDKEETDDMSLFVKKFSKFPRRNKGARTCPMKKFSKSNEASLQTRILHALSVANLAT
ncbi:hypothetical protein Lal_00039750 [Lupinus albus]|nr:hypothetical protein Lal_00039750 [Lupinus albus]